MLCVLRDLRYVWLWETVLSFQRVACSIVRQRSLHNEWFSISCRYFKIIRKMLFKTRGTPLFAKRPLHPSSARWAISHNPNRAASFQVMPRILKKSRDLRGFPLRKDSSNFVLNSAFWWRKANLFSIKVLLSLAGSQGVICLVDMRWQSCPALGFVLCICWEWTWV